MFRSSKVLVFTAFIFLSFICKYSVSYAVGGTISAGGHWCDLTGGGSCACGSADNNCNCDGPPVNEEGKCRWGNPGVTGNIQTITEMTPEQKLVFDNPPPVKAEPTK